MPRVYHHELRCYCRSFSALRLSRYIILFLLVTNLSHIEATKGDRPGCHNCIGNRTYQEGCPAINIPTSITTKRFYLYNLQRMNWFGAHQFCTMHGMRLATVDDDRENQELISLMKTGVVSDVWIGVTDLGVEDEFYKSGDGGRVEYTTWAPGQPDNGGDGEHCARYARLPGADSNLAWIDDACSAQHYVACDLTRPT